MTVVIAVAAAFLGIAAGAIAVWVALSGRVADRRLERMMAEMRNVTVSELSERERELASRNTEQVKSLLAPMQQRLDDFTKAAEASRKTNGELGVKIEDFFKGIRETSASFGAQARSFTDALTGANKKQGNWGEAILGRVLEDCGLKEGVHYIAQAGSVAGIPDYQIFDPGGAKILVVDSKMSWTRYEQAYRMPEGEERRAALREHVKSVRNHIDELCKADYPNRLSPPRAGYSYVPLTAMFVPCDAALAAALESDPSIVDYACKRNIALVSPLTLFGFLILVSRAWSRYDIDRNTENIREEARKLVGYVDRLYRDLEETRDLLAKAAQKHEAAMRLAAAEPSGQCLKGPALRIISLGAKPEREFKSKAMTEP